MAWHDLSFDALSSEFLQPPGLIYVANGKHLDILDYVMGGKKSGADIADPSSNEVPFEFDASLIRTTHNSYLYQQNEKLKKQINDLVDYELAHPKHPKPTTREEIENERKIDHEIDLKERKVKGQLGIVRSLYRQSVVKVRDEKAKTADDRAVNDALILGLHNLKYEEQSLRSEIAAAENYEYVLTIIRICRILADTFVATSTRSSHSSPRKSFSRNFHSTPTPLNMTL